MKSCIVCYGGSFDPIHNGHLMLMLDSWEQLMPEHLIVIPAAQSPHKKTRKPADDHHRLEMIRLATQDFPWVRICEEELQSGGLSYTIHTVRHLAALYPQHQLFWLMGADQLATLPLWHEARELSRLTGFAVAARQGFALNPSLEGLPDAQIKFINTHQMSISSTEIRERASRRAPLIPLVPESVAHYLNENRIYE